MLIARELLISYFSEYLMRMAFETYHYLFQEAWTLDHLLATDRLSLTLPQ